MSTYRFSFPTLIHFGSGVRSQLPDFLKANQIRRPLVVTDRGVADLPFFHEIRAGLERAELSPAVFSQIEGNPVESQVKEGVSAFRAHEADSVVGVGGGAALDVAKAIALMVEHPGDLFDYEDEKPGARPIDGPIPFWVAVPTTSGTGSEVGRSAVISDEITHIKKILFSPRLLAKAVFADPELTLGLSSAVTAATGMDALTHCVEAYLAKGYHPICDGIALEGLRLVSESLEKCVKNPKDIEARSSMMMASMMGAIAFQKGLGLTHSCAHALSTATNMHHGLANGIMITHALPLNISTCPERFARMASVLDLKEKSGKGFIRWLEELKGEISIPDRLSFGGGVGELADLAFADSCHLNNPRPCTREDFVRVFQEALSC